MSYKQDHNDEMQMWHVSGVDESNYRCHVLYELLPPGSNRLYEVKRGDVVKAVLFNRRDADVACFALARTAVLALLELKSE